MIKYNNTRHRQVPRSYKEFASMGRKSVGLINKLYSPIDATNRFLNLALVNVEEESEIRQFLLESKSGLRKMSTLLKRLSNYAKRMEKEFYEISKKQKCGKNPPYK